MAIKRQPSQATNPSRRSAPLVAVNRTAVGSCGRLSESNQIAATRTATQRETKTRRPKVLI